LAVLAHESLSRQPQRAGQPRDRAPLRRAAALDVRDRPRLHARQLRKSGARETRFLTQAL
jgi:hypothetical protein